MDATLLVRPTKLVSRRVSGLMLLPALLEVRLVAKDQLVLVMGRTWIRSMREWRLPGSTSRSSAFEEKFSVLSLEMIWH